MMRRLSFYIVVVLVEPVPEVSDTLPDWLSENALLISLAASVIIFSTVERIGLFSVVSVILPESPPLQAAKITAMRITDAISTKGNLFIMFAPSCKN